MKTSFGKMLKEIMDQQGFNQMKLADALDVRQSQVSNWINEKSLPGYHSIRGLCQTLGITADALLELEEQ